jgi:glycosyltransferase involved in cell wall biosynthesis
MQKLKIAILSPIVWRTPPRKMGAWELVASTITEELVRRGHDVTLFASGDSITKAKLHSVAPYPINEPPESQKPLENKLYTYMHSAEVFEMADQFDIIHNNFDAYPLAFSKLVKTPVISTIHGFSSPQIKDMYMRYNQTSYVSISYADRQNCPEMNWVANIYHGIDVSKIPFGLETQDYYAFLGRVHPTKGTHLAIQAALKAGVRLKIAAFIDYSDKEIINYWNDHCLPFIDGDQIVFLGEVGEVEKYEMLKGAIATLCPLQWNEPFGLVFIESMSTGTPVIAYDRGSVSEVVKNNVGGIVVQPDDMNAYVEAIKSVNNLDRQAVRNYAETEFSIEHMVDQYEQAYAKILGIDY